MSGFLVIGLGSMGKRRVRCLMALGTKNSDIWGIDVRGDRREEAEKKYGINTAESENEIDFSNIKAVIVSLPPDKHRLGVEIAARYGKPVFVEASVVLADVIKIKEICGNIFVAPSITMRYHPMIKEIYKIVQSGELGKVCNFSYHSGQYLPDWHTWEDVKDYYVSSRETGGAREIVPFELTWITDLFGFPKDIKGYFRRTGEIGCDIEDSYVCSLDYGDMIGSLLVDVMSRYPARNLIINFQEGQLQWKWDEEKIQVYRSKTDKITYINQPKQVNENGYSSMIGEQMYIDEIAAFLSGIDDSTNYPNSVDRDIKVLKLLDKLENSDGGFIR